MENINKLKSGIINLSVNKDWENAKQEWYFTHIDYLDNDEDFEKCVCGHEIRELCFIKNKITRQEVFIGNICIKQFINVDIDNLVFVGLKKIKDDIYSNANKALIDYAYEQGYIYPREVDFLENTVRKRNLTAKQLEWKIKINNRILNRIKVN